MPQLIFSSNRFNPSIYIAPNTWFIRMKIFLWPKGISFHWIKKFSWAKNSRISVIFASARVAKWLLIYQLLGQPCFPENVATDIKLFNTLMSLYVYDSNKVIEYIGAKIWNITLKDHPPKNQPPRKHIKALPLIRYTFISPNNIFLSLSVSWFCVVVSKFLQEKQALFLTHPCSFKQS